MSIQQTIFEQLKAGSGVNPGLPARLAELATAQAAHETNNFTSNVFKTDNNAFGYKWVGSRYQERKGLPAPKSEGGFYGHYINVNESAKELIDWIYRRKKESKFPNDLSSIHTPEQYARYLKQSGFYGDRVSTYAARLRYWLGENSSKLGLAFFLVALLGLGGIYYYNKSKKKTMFNKVVTFTPSYNNNSFCLVAWLFLAGPFLAFFE